MVFSSRLCGNEFYEQGVVVSTMRMPKLDVQDQGWAAQELPIP